MNIKKCFLLSSLFIPPFLTIFSFVFNRRKQFIQVWNNLREGKWWQNLLGELSLYLTLLEWFRQGRCSVKCWVQMQMQMQMLSSNVHKCTRKLNKIRECNISFFFWRGGGGAFCVHICGYHLVRWALVFPAQQTQYELWHTDSSINYSYAHISQKDSHNHLKLSSNLSRSMNHSGVCFPPQKMTYRMHCWRNYSLKM